VKKTDYLENFIKIKILPYTCFLHNNLHKPKTKIQKKIEEIIQCYCNLNTKIEKRELYLIIDMST